MSEGVSGAQVFEPSPDLVVRDIEGQIVLVPLTSGVGDLEAELFSLNETGKAVWEHLDGKRSVDEVIAGLQAEYEDPDGEIPGHVGALLTELAARGMVVDVAGA